jgi:subtilisin family serine protease
MITVLTAGGVQRGQDQTIKQGYRQGVLVVKFKSTATTQANFKISRNNRGVATIGISSIDKLNADAGVTAINRDEFYVPQNKALAKQLGFDRMYMMFVPNSTDIPALAKRYAADPNIENVAPDWEAYPTAIPNDPLYSSQWGHNNTAQMLGYNWSTFAHDGPPVGTVGFDANAQSAWDGTQGYGSNTVKIGIIDTGVDWLHPDLTIATKSSDPIDGVDNDGNGKIDDYRGWDFGANDNNPDDNSSSAGHGTACSGVAAAISNNALGVSGIAGGCLIMPLKVANNAGSMTYTAITNAVTYGADNGCKVLSMSLGGSSSDANLQNACTYAWNLGVVVLAATGNENNTILSYPAAMTNVIGVGAASNCGDRKRSSSSSADLNPGVFADPNSYTCDGERWWGSNYGSTTKDAANAVDVIAPTILPTTDIRSTGGYDPSDYDLYFNGTSCATPYAAGVCALIFSKNPTWTATQVRNQLCNTAQDIVNVESVAGWDRYSGYGMVDAAAAVGIGATPTVTVTVPNGGENWTANTNQNITWSSTGSITNVSIDYSTNGGTNWTSIIASTANDGSHTWTVANTPTTTTRVRVSDASNGAVTDMSNANFTISAPDVTPPVISGVSASGITNSTATITWTTDEASNSVVNYGLTTSYGSNASNASMVTSHSVSLSGLTANTLYHYRVNSTDASNNTATSGDFTFTTANTLSPIETFSDGNFTANPAWAGSTTQFSVATSSDAGAGATNSFTLRLASTAAATRYLSTQRTASWGTEQSWSFWMGRRAQAATNTNYSVVWLWANESNLTSATVDGYRIRFGDDTGGDNVVLQSVTNGVATNILTSTGTTTNGITDYGFMVRVTRTSASLWTVYTSTLPTASGTGAVASTQPTAANTSVNQGSVTNSTYTAFANGYFGFMAVTSSGSSARAAAEFDQLYFDVSATSPMSKTIAQEVDIAGDNSVPQSFQLHQNYPNPFNPTTNIRFDLPVDGFVTMTVHDVLGKEVARLMNEEQKAGSYDVNFDGSQLSSGVYFYRFNVSGVNGSIFSDMKKLVLMK